MTIEAQYTVGEYDILILSAQQSTGLETWLRENGYRIPAGAGTCWQLHRAEPEILRRESQSEGAGEARLHRASADPGRVRIAEVHVANPSRHGKRGRPAGAVRLRADTEGAGRSDELSDGEAAERHRNSGLCEGDAFATFYKAMFARQVAKENMSAIFTEYAWDMGWCDPCAADPLSNDELRQLGVFWMDEGGSGRRGGISCRCPRARLARS